MKKIFLIIVLFSTLSFPQFDKLGILFDSGVIPIAYLESSSANAITDEQGEVNATTGWGTALSATVGSQSIVKQTGGYALLFASTVAGGRAFCDIQTLYGLEIGQEYTISYYIRHSGSGGVWGYGFNDDGGNGMDVIISASIANTATTFTLVTVTFTHSSLYRYILVKELNATNDGGVYIDDLKIQ